MKLPTLPNPATMSRRERLLAFGSILVVSMVLLDRLVLGPWSAHTTRVRGEIQRLETSLHSQSLMLSRKPQIVAEAEPYHDYLHLETSKELDTAALIKQIEDMGRESGISLKQLKPLPDASNDQYAQYSFEAQVQGSLRQWVHFIYLLQASKSLFEIERSTVAKTEADVDALDGTVRVSSKMAHQYQPL